MSRVQVLDGFTAYGIAVKHGFHGTEEEWLESLHANENVHPVAADESMTIPVGVDEAGGLHAGKDPEVVQLKNDKLDKRPSTWPTWTPDEQNAAIERLGVDNPYELIEDFTLEEDVTSIKRTAEPDGTPYNLSSIIISLYVPGAGATNTATVRINNLYQTIGQIQNFTHETSERDSDIFAVVKGGKILAFTRYGAIGMGNATNVLTSTIGLGRVSAKSINNIEIISKIIPAGTRIIINGVRK